MTALMLYETDAPRVEYVQDIAGSVSFDGLMRTDDQFADDSVELARQLLTAALGEETAAERRRRERLGTLLDDPAGRELILALTDEVMRISDRRTAAHRFAGIVGQYPTTALGAIDALLMRIGALVAPRLPWLVMPLVVRRITSETRGIVLPADDPQLAGHIARRCDEGFRLNINPLGEAILSDAEADLRMDTLVRTIGRSDVDYVSVKISSVVANLDVLAFDASVERVNHRLRALYRAAVLRSPATFVNLDMEEYGDLELTLEAFMTVLSEPEFLAVDAGIVLQAYLPDSHDAARRLGEWANQRRVRGGGRVKVRVVKGANLAMELVDAELHGWSAAPYGTKAEVDASYKALIESLLRPEWADSIRVGVASHNLFDVAFAVLLGREMAAGARMDIEMLEGMAPAQARVVQEFAGSVLMYSPVVASTDFDASIAYLARRLDENTQPDNFLRALFTLHPESPEFDRQAHDCRTSIAARHRVSDQRRRRPIQPEHPHGSPVFENEPDTDFTDPEARRRAAEAIAACSIAAPTPTRTTDEIDAIVASAVAAARAQVGVAARQQWLRAMADVMRAERFDTLAVMAHETAKTVAEGDPEVSEGIDFCTYYAMEAGRLASLGCDGLEVRGRGVVAVIAPWNFPYAIPAGGVAAALAAGNSVVLKPAPEAVAVAALLARQFWAAGVPRDVLQLVVCDDGPIGRRLVTHPSVDTVVLTGSLATASMFLSWKPELRLLAETSGKNSLVITASADLDDAIRDLVRSAFGHAGQKCSATSLAIVEASVYDSEHFMSRLRDAVRSLRVGPATDLDTMVGPIIAEPTGPLLRALTELDDHETWLVEPVARAVDGELAGRLWSCGVRTGVRPGSWFHRTECFGPVLGIMRADDLDHAIRLQNDTQFGLTGGLHSLDPDEIATWTRTVQVGNGYVNRATTGAVVQRQPFGGWRRSSVGGGTKAGGPGYVTQFAQITDDCAAGEDLVARARISFDEAWRSIFAVEHDPSALLSERNVQRYRPIDAVAVRHDGSTQVSLEILRQAAATVGVELVESDARVEPDESFAHRCTRVDRVRLLTALSSAARSILHEHNVPIDGSAPVSVGSVELYRWVREQAISQTMHRHGRLPPARN
jgi:RHH-type proline utilization regulon transcriptional repressor/proline dehydrogenase/delta 1-pyrroline-5-carboxylate dehydrogenase